MATVPIRELRNHAGDVVDRVQAGERITVTHAGRPVMDLVPVARPPLTAAALLARWRNLPVLDSARLRRDLAEVLDDSP